MRVSFKSTVLRSFRVCMFSNITFIRMMVRLRLKSAQAVCVRATQNHHSSSFVVSVNASELKDSRHFKCPKSRSDLRKCQFRFLVILVESFRHIITLPHFVITVHASESIDSRQFIESNVSNPVLTFARVIIVSWSFLSCHFDMVAEQVKNESLAGQSGQVIQMAHDDRITGHQIITRRGEDKSQLLMELPPQRKKGDQHVLS